MPENTPARRRNLPLVLLALVPALALAACGSSKDDGEIAANIARAEAAAKRAETAQHAAETAAARARSDRLAATSNNDAEPVEQQKGEVSRAEQNPDATANQAPVSNPASGEPS